MPLLEMMMTMKLKFIFFTCREELVLHFHLESVLPKSESSLLSFHLKIVAMMVVRLFSVIVSFLLTLELVTPCPESSAIDPCSCSSTFKRRSASGFQNQYHISCKNATYSTLKSIFRNISRTQGVDEVFDHFSGSHLFPPGVQGHIEDDFLSGLKIKSLVITHSNVVSFGAKAFRGVTDSLDLSHNLIEFLPFNLNLMVRKVNFSGNRMSEIGPNTFASQTIDLSFNQISLIREKAFKVESVLNLNLEGNNLEPNSLQPGFIHSFSKIEDLSLGLFLNNNNLSYLDSDVFSPLLSSSSVSVNLAGNPLRCDCRGVKWLLDSKRYDKNWATVFPRVESAICEDGSDLMKDFYDTDLNNCVDDIMRDDPDIFAPCKMTFTKNLRCYRISFDALRESVSPLNSLFSRPIFFDQVILDRVMFSADALLDKSPFEVFRVKQISLLNTNVRTVDPNAFDMSTFSTTAVSLKGNRLNDDSNVFEFVSKFVNLERLDLSGNQISTVPGNVFARMSCLQYVSLQSNTIKHISTDAFRLPIGSSFYRPLIIELQSNELTEKSFHPHFIDVPDSIKVTLNLERNQITQINDNYSTFIVELLGRSGRNSHNHAIILNENPLVCTNLLREIIRKYFVTFGDCDDYKKTVQ